MHFVAQLVRQIPHVGAHADSRGEPVVGVAIQVVEKILAVEIRLRHAPVTLVKETKVAVNIDQRGRDGLAGQVDAGGAGRKTDLALLSDSRKPVVLNEEGGILYGGFAIADDQPRALEQDRGCWRSGLWSSRL